MTTTDSGRPAAAEGVTRRLAAHVAATRYEALSPQAVHAFKRACLDYLTCAITGADTPVSRTLVAYLRENDGMQHASVLGTDARLSAPNAAFANGAAVHGWDFDDGFTEGSTHPAGATFPAVFAMAEKTGAGARQVIAAMAVAYDLMLRISAAMHPTSAQRGYHNTPNAGVFGAAAGVANLLGAGATAVINALGLAGSHAAGLREYLAEGAEVKRLHPGKAARDGVICAELGLRGITGPTRILEGRYGYLQAISGEKTRWARLTEALGERYEIERAYFKPYPCCRHFHGMIDGIVELKRRHGIDPKLIERVEVGMYAVGANGHDHKHCESVLDAQMSAPVTAALALTHPALATTTFAPEHYARAEVRALTERVEVHVDDECQRIYPGRRSNAVRILMRDGAAHEARIVDPKGEGENPMTDADLEEKFLANCAPILGEARARRAAARVWAFETQENLAEFFALA